MNYLWQSIKGMSCTSIWGAKTFFQVSFGLVIILTKELHKIEAESLTG